MMDYDSEAIAKRIGLFVGNWLVLLTIPVWGGPFLFIMFFWQLRDGVHARQQAINAMTGRGRIFG